VEVQLIAADPSVKLIYSRDKVQATLVGKEEEVPYLLSDVPVTVDGPPDLFDQWKIAPNDKFLPGFEVIGPPAQIEKLKNHDVSPFPIAVWEVNFKEVHSAGPIAPVTLEIRHLPEGVRVNGPYPQMAFTVTSR
jgi:hypothetical protein